MFVLLTGFYHRGRRAIENRCQLGSIPPESLLIILHLSELALVMQTAGYISLLEGGVYTQLITRRGTAQV